MCVEQPKEGGRRSSPLCSTICAGRMHEPTALVGEWLQKAVLGYYQYHAVPGNINRLALFQYRLRVLWRFILFRRSQKGRKGLSQNK